MSVARFGALGILILALLTGCADQATDPEGASQDNNDAAPVSFGEDIQPIFDVRCATPACHAGSNPEGELSLASGVSYTSLVGVESPTYTDPALRVDPGNPAGSLLLLKVQGADGTGNRMPVGASPLSAAQISLIETWIEEGAADD